MKPRSQKHTLYFYATCPKYSDDVQYIICAISDKLFLCDLAHNSILCVNSDIDVLCDLAHNDNEGVYNV